MAEEDLSSESYPIQESTAPPQLSQSTNKVHGEALTLPIQETCIQLTEFKQT